jgi:hypothetical protein
VATPIYSLSADWKIDATYQVTISNQSDGTFPATPLSSCSALAAKATLATAASASPSGFAEYYPPVGWEVHVASSKQGASDVLWSGGGYVYSIARCNNQVQSAMDVVSKPLVVSGGGGGLGLWVALALLGYFIFKK